MSRSEEPSGTPDHNATKGVVTRVSPWSVDDTVARLEAVLAARGIKLFTIIDQSAEANAVGLRLRETRLAIFGSPKAGTPVMEAVPLAALDLPLKVIVWKDGDQTKVSYTDPAELAQRYHLEDDLAERLAAVPGIVNAVIDR
jgi:uncharacterized protein (DUF302 family)